MAPNVKRIGLFAKKEGVKNSQDMNHLYDIGTLASYETWPHNPTESPYVILRSHGKLKRINPSMGKLSSIQYAQCQIIKEEAVKVIPEIRVLCYQIIDFVRRLQPFFPYNSASEELNRRMLNAVYWSYCASDFTMPCEPSRLQTILEEGSLLERLKKTAKVLYEELNFFNISSQMTQKIKEGEIRESYLYNLTRLKNLVDHTIHHYDAHNQKSSDVPRSVSAVFGQGQKNESSFEKKIRERLKELILPANVQTVIDEELSRISSLDKSSLEYGIIQTYLDNLTLVPWGIFSATNTTLSHAQNVLNEDHFGLEEVKDTILEHLAVATRMERSKGRILCFVGPPGVGKTSIVKSIARALNRQYVRISVGGIDDSCEIKGHRRTYIGAMPGKIIKGLQMAKSLDPQQPLLVVRY
ncbi:hypothetical protein MXB_2464 [Myxobolus squamalis]|nr:hypothetical protein MXB_2464 [Myxobolus squamalis]